MAHRMVNMVVILASLFVLGASENDGQGTKWAVLVAGSNDYSNYRHQADVCHAYQILKKGGLKDENIIVFMYDDIASNEENPRLGVIINNPRGGNVYQGVPKDYTGNNVTTSNLLAVILGNKRGLKDGSGKVVNSGPNDHIFIYYTDHGGPGVLSMPSGDDLYAKDFIEALKKKHASGTYKSMVIYVEACEAGSIFDGLLPKGLNIYVTTASNPSESSYATYCPQLIALALILLFPVNITLVWVTYIVYLGWKTEIVGFDFVLLDSDQKNRQTETLEKQYQVVKNRTGNAAEYSSHVMEYGDTNLSGEFLAIYMGATSSSKHQGKYTPSKDAQEGSSAYLTSAVDQHQADLVYLKEKWLRAPEGSKEKNEARNKLDEEMSHRKHVDNSIRAIRDILFGSQNGAVVLNTVRPAGKPLVDDWDCLKTTVKIYTSHCGPLSTYGKKYMRAFANTCNAGIHEDHMAQASSQACT
ncbi:hypothetical protein Ancab_023003 [Ancistrocladus abbreviatus]